MGSVTRERRTDRQPVENPAYMEMMARIVKAAGRRIGEGDVEDIARLLAIRDQLDQALNDGVRELHRQGESWTRIARGAGITRQAARQRWGM